MVYTIVLIVGGIKLNRNEVQTYFDVDEYGYVDDDVLEGKIKLYSFPCCSKLQGQTYILGQKIQKYHRKIKECGQPFDDGSYICGEKRIVCDKCLGETTNGPYDVIKIYEEPTTCNPKHLCGNCKSDNREEFTICKMCNLEYNEVKFGSATLDKISEEVKAPIEFYYMIDDCLSCS